MSMSNLIELSITEAGLAHIGQIDADGMPHLMHCMAVMLAVQKELDEHPIIAGSECLTTEEVLIAAVLHDTIEDNKFFTIEKTEQRFGKNVAVIVDTLTRREGESYRDFIYRCKTNRAARLIKICDLLHNRSRTHKISTKKAGWREKLEYKYRIATAVLNDVYEPTWEGASFEYKDGRYWIADPDGKRIEITEAEAKNVKASFTHYN
jgi:(p)ppGpp synthase/HD superfamily hydrolase